MAIRGVLFDKDGTLIDVMKTWLPVYRSILQQLMPERSGEHPKLLAAAGYDPLTNNFTGGSIIAGGTTEELVDLWWPEVDAADRRNIVTGIENDFHGLSTRYLTPLMPLEPVLSELQDMGLALGVATNDNEVAARSHIEALNAISFFGCILGCDSVERPKPSGDMVREFAGRTGLKPSEVAMVGDNRQDMQAAREGGAGLAIAVLSGNSRHDDIAALADHVLSDVSQLPALLRSL